METNQAEVIQATKNQADMTTEVPVVPQVLYPWRRYWARSIDLLICEILWSAFLWSVFHVGLMGRSL